MRQMRLRLRTKPESAAESSDAVEGWVIVRGRTPMPYAVVKLGDQFRPNLRAGVVYTDSLEAARRYMPADALMIAGFEAARLVKALPASFGEVVEVWF
jgi:hypothetical protein